ncbi:MAG: hypothetical protein PHC68_00410 [Syntrophorhabdaceae bacterium]|nr:hypothetical protein [Syntrophorhabdaceae bacterium]
MVDFDQLAGELELPETEIGVPQPKESVAQYKDIGHPFGAAKSAVFDVLESPAIALFQKPGAGWRGWIDAARKNDPDVNAWMKAVEDKTEPFLGEWVGSLGHTASGLAMRYIPYVGPLLTISLYTNLQQEEIESKALELGADERTAKITSWVAGPIAALPDIVGNEFIFRTVRGKALANLLTSIGTATGVAHAIAGTATTLVKTGAVEGGTEGMQGVMSYLAEQWAARPPDETAGAFSQRMADEKHAKEMWEIAKHDTALGALSGVFFGGMGLTAETMTARAKAKTAPTEVPPAISEAPIAPPPEEGAPEEPLPTATTVPSGSFETRFGRYLAGEKREIARVQAEIDTNETLKSDPDYQARQKRIADLWRNLRFEQMSWDSAISNGREPSDRLASMIARHTEELAGLSEEQKKVYDAFKERMTKDVEAGIDKAESPKVIEGQPVNPEDKYVVKPSEEESWLDNAIRRVGGVPGVEEGAAIRAKNIPETSGREYMGARGEEVAVEKPARVEEGPLKVTLPGGKGWIEGEITPDKFYLHDVYVEKGERGAGFGLKAVRDTVDAYPDKEIWVASTSKGMDKIAEKLGFEKVAGKGRKPEGIPEQVSQNNATVWKKAPGAVKFGFGKELKKGQVVDGVRYDGPWEGIGHAWTDMETKRSFTTETTDKAEINKKRAKIVEGKAKFGLSPEEQRRLPSIQPEGRINGITRTEAGEMLANGDDTVLEHIKQGVKEHGPLVMQDAIQNEILRAVKDSKGTDSQQQVIKNLRRMEPLVREIVKTPSKQSDLATAIKASFQKIARVFKNAPIASVITDASQIPEEHRALMDKGNPDWQERNPKGVFLETRQGPVVYIFANNMTSVGEAQLWYLHEIVGHYGLHGAFGNALNSILDRVWMSFGKSKAMEDIVKRYFKGDFDNNNAEHRRTASEEFIADLATKFDLTQKEKTLLDRVRQFLREVLSKFGFDVKMTEGDLDSILAKSLEYVKGGEAQGKVGENVRFAQGKEPAPFTYSALQKAVNFPDMPSKVQSIPNYLARKGVTREEIAWTGLNQWLEDNKQGDKIDREQLRAYIAMATEETEMGEVELLGKDLASQEDRINAIRKVVGRLSPEEATIFWENFDEVDLSPDNQVRLKQAKTDEERITIASKASWESLREIFGNTFQLENDATKEWARYEGYFSEAHNYRELVIHLPNMGRGKDYRSPHWDGSYTEGETINDVAFHVLIDESKGEGPRELNVLELQGDWPQDLAKKQGTPDFPFAHNWVKLGIQKMIRYAAEKGYDKVTFPHPDELIKHWGSDRYAWKSISAISLEDFNERTNLGKYKRGEVESYLEELGIEIKERLFSFSDGKFRRGDEYSYELIDQGQRILENDSYEQAIKNAIEYARDEKVGKKSWQLSYTSQVGGHARGFDLQQEADRLAREGKFQQYDTTEVSSRQDVEDLMRRMRIVKSHHTDAYVARKVDQLWNKMQKSPESGALLPRKEGMEFAYGEKIPGALEKFAKQFGATVERESSKPKIEFQETDNSIEVIVDGKVDNVFRWERNLMRDNEARYSALRDAKRYGKALEDEVKRKFSITINNKMRETAIFQGFARFAFGKVPDTISTYIGKHQTTMGEAVSKAWDSVKSKEFRAYIRTKVFSRLDPVKQMIGLESYKVLSLQNGAPVVFDTLLTDGKLKWDGKVLTCDTRGQGFIPWLEAMGKDANKFLYWTMAKRAEALETQTIRKRDPNTGRMVVVPKERWLTETVRNEIYKWAGDKDKSEWVAKAKELDEWNKNTLDIAEKAGLINHDARGSWEQDFYIPFYRIMENAIAKNKFMLSPNKSRRFISAQIRRLEGAEMKVGDPLENMLKNWNHLITASIENVARETCFEEAKTKGMGLVEEVGFKDLHVFKRGTGSNSRMVYVTKRDQKNVLVFQRDGKPIYFKVDSEPLFEALGGVEFNALNGVAAKFFSAPKRLLTYSATFGPAFKVSNMIRDAIHTSLIDKDFGRPPSPLLEPLFPLFALRDALKGVRKAWNNDLDMVRLKAAGGAFGTSYIHSQDMEIATKRIERILRKEKGAIVLSTFEKALDWWERVGAASENAVRVQSFATKTKNGMSTLDAAFAVRDYLDFSRYGSSRAVQLLIHIIPFLNARMQGNYKLFNTATQAETMVNFGVRGTLLTLASLMLWGAFKDDDRYKELEEWDRMAYYHWWIGDTHVRMPKPFEIGVFFSSIPEAIANVICGNDEGKHVWNVMWKGIRDVFAMDLPQVIKPIYEQWANKTFFTGRPIVGAHLEGLIPGEQHDPWTSETLQGIGKQLGVSPNRMKALIDGYFSTIGIAIIGGADVLTRTFFDFPAKPTMKIDDYPLIGTFLKEAEHPRYIKQQTKFYEIFDEYDKIAKTMHYYRNLGDPKAALELAEDNRPLIAAGKQMTSTKEQLRKIRANMRLIWSSPSLTSDEKLSRLNTLADKQNVIVKAAYRKAQEKVAK